MFTTGSKFYLGISTLAAIVSVVFLITNDQVALGCVALLGLMVSAGIIAGASLASRDGGETENATTSAASNSPTTASPTKFIWPTNGSVIKNFEANKKGIDIKRKPNYECKK